MNNEERILEMLEKLTEKVDRQGEVLEEHSGILTKHSEILEKHTEILEKHSKILAKHSEMLEEQGKLLAKHSEMLEEQGKLLAKHSDALEELDGRSLRTAVILENEVLPKLQLLYEGQVHLQETLAPKERVEVLEDEVITLKSTIKMMMKRLDALERAQ